MLAWVERCNGEKGLRIFAQALTVDVGFEFTLEDRNLFDSSPLWRELTLGDAGERLAKMRDPERRGALRAEFDAGRGPVAGGGTEERDVRVGTGIAELLIEWVSSDAPAELKRFEVLTVGEVASAWGRHPVDAMLDLAVESDLRTGFATPARATNVEAMREIVTSPYALPGVSDGGAHTKFITLGACATEFLTTWVRTHELLSLEDAHWRLSAHPAMAAGFRDRGWIREGSPADLIVYDLDELRMLDAERTYDDPAGDGRHARGAAAPRRDRVVGRLSRGRPARRRRRPRRGTGGGSRPPCWP